MPLDAIRVTFERRHLPCYDDGMIYVALLRGINVGGNNKIEMARLKATFERAGMSRVSTYINSGNVIFSSRATDTARLERRLERAIRDDFGLTIPVLLRSAKNIIAAADALPDEWANDRDTKCDVLFLGRELDSPGILDRLTVKPGIDKALYVPGAVLWRVAKPDATRSGLMRIAGTEMYRQMTIRNCNTLRKLASMIRDAGLQDESSPA